jgi:type IV pilus assembly protein PilB
LARATRKRLGEILIDQGLIHDEHLIAALQEQKRTGELLGEALVRMGYATEDDIAGTIVIQFGLPFLPVKKYRIREELKTMFPPALLRQYQFLPVDRIGRVMSVVAGGLLTPDILSELEQMCGSRILVYVGRLSDVREVIESEFAAAVAKAEKDESSPATLSSLGNMLLGE